MTTVERIAEVVAQFVEEANTTDNSALDTLIDSLDMDKFMDMVNQQTAEMTAIIADEIAKSHGVPALAVAGQAHGMAITHLALFMFAAGQRIKADEFAAADGITDDMIEKGLSEILGGSNE
jgi:hypothetical protein